MNLVNKAAFVAILAFAVQSHAADAKARASSADGIEKVSAEAPAKGEVTGKQFGGDGASTLNTNTTTPQSTSSASLPEAIKAASPRKIFGELYTETYTGYDAFTQGKGNPRMDSYGGLKFDLGNSRAFSIRQNFDYTGVQSGGAGTFHVQDLALNYADGKLATIMGDGSLTIIAREYLPTGENSRFLNGREGAERLYLIAAKSYAKLDLDALVVGQLNHNTKDSYINSKGEETQNVAGFATFEVDSLYNISDKFAAGLTLEYDHNFQRALAGKTDAQMDFIVEPIIQYQPVKGIAIQAALVNTIDTGNPTKDFEAFRQDELQAYFNLSATL